MNKIYKVSKIHATGYDEYDGAIIIAKDRKQLKRLLSHEEEYEVETLKGGDALFEYDYYWEEDDEIIYIGETKMKTTILMSSFNAG